MPRYKLSQKFLDMPYPWSSESVWDRNGVIKLGGESYLLIKLASGGLQNAVPSPLMAFSLINNVLTNVTRTLFPKVKDFAITRDLLVDDFNNDGYQDIFLSNHGPEVSSGAFPGENNAIYLYQPVSGTYKETIISGMDFSHGSCIGDFNGDGLKDIYVNNLGATSGIKSYALKQLPSGDFSQTVLSTTFVNSVGPLTTAIDVGNDGKSELATINTNGALVIWDNLLSASPTQLTTPFPLPISEKGVFEIKSADFDSNGKQDLLIVGTGDEITNSSGTVIGGMLKAYVVFNAGLASQRCVNPFEQLGIKQISTGGIRVELIDLDNSGTIDFELRTYDTSWAWHRYTLYANTSGEFSVTHNSDNTIAISAQYIDVNHDGIPDLVSDQYGKLRVQFGELMDRVDGRAYDISGNAGITAKVLGAVFGKLSLNNKQYVGIGLNLLDQGMSYDALAALALAAAKAHTNDQIVTTLWSNIVGTTPTPSDKAPFIKMLEDGMTPGSLARMAADTPLNTANINLVGLAMTGIEFTPPN